VKLSKHHKSQVIIPKKAMVVAEGFHQ